MNGPHLDEELSALLDGELSDDELVVVRQHLSECAFCTSELAALDRTRSLVRSLPPVSPLRPLGLPDDETTPRGVRLLAYAAGFLVALLAVQSLPGGQSVSPSLASLVALHASRSVNADPGDVAAGSPPLVQTRVLMKKKAAQAEFDVVPVAKEVPLADKYTVLSEPGRSVAGRETVGVTVVDSRTGKVVERAALDKETGMVMWREVYDEAGNVERTVEAESVERAGATAPVPPQRSAGRLIPTPDRLDGDYWRVAVYRDGDVVHQLFSDGLHTLSVFAEAGDLDEGDMPRNRTIVPLRTQPASHYDWPGGDVLVWESGGVVYTAVGDGPAEDMRAAAASMPATRDLSWGEKVRRNCRHLVDALV